MPGIQEVKKDYKNLFIIDSNLNKLVKNIELLRYVNPLNIDRERNKFYASKYNYEPQFVYPKINFNSYKLHQLFFSQKIELIENEVLKKLYEDVIYSYSDLISCIGTIGKGKSFYYNSLRSFGAPTEVSIANAKFILHFNAETENTELEPKFDASFAQNYFEEFSTRYGFDYKIKLSNKISAAAMVLSNTRTLVLNKNKKFSANQLKVLANHEIGVHLVTTFNALNQPLSLFLNGLPGNVETQEGLAVFSEYMSNSMTITRLRELAFRVIAVDSLIKGLSFSGTFDLLFNQYKLSRDKAYIITLRVHRGGGFTKDHLYLSGLVDIFNQYKKEKKLDNLLIGKVATPFDDKIDYMKSKGLCNPPLYFTDAFLENKNTNNQIDFILKSLN